MEIEVSIEILSSPDRVWPILIDVQRWPEWTASITRVERLDDGEFGVGSRAHVRQPRLLPMVWRVSEFQQGHHFTWEAHAPGAFAIARHVLEPSARGSVVTLSIEQRGLLASILNPFIRGLTSRYIQMEAQGLKTRCEATARSWTLPRTDD